MFRFHSTRSEARSTLDRRTTDNGGLSFYDPHQHPPTTTNFEHQSMNRKTDFNFMKFSLNIVCFLFINVDPALSAATQHTPRTMTSHQHSTDYYKQLTEELNKCFDDIELFVRYLESLVEYTKELERDHRRKDKKSTR